MSHVHVEKKAPVRSDVSVGDPLLTVGDEATSVAGLRKGPGAVRDIYDKREYKSYLG